MYRSAQYNSVAIRDPRITGIDGGNDNDAAAFLLAAGIVDSRQQRAIFELTRLLKQYGLWSKMKAIYPFIGGTASSHKWNLKDPRDVDAAFRLTFDGGWTHSSTGADPNGTNAIADTKLIPSTSLTKYNTHASTYLRENTDGVYFDIGATNNGSTEIISIYARSSNATLADTGNYTVSRISATNTDSRGLFTVKRSSATDLKIFKNGTQLGSNTSNDTANLPSFKIYLGATIIGSNTAGAQWSNREIAFATIGDGLTDTEAANLYYAVDVYQRILGRAVTAKDTDAQAFVNAAVLTDTTQIGAIDNLVSDLKSAGLWSKMKAIYPFIGGTATSHMYNLKDPRNLDAAFRLTFSGGWTHSSTGVKPNGTNGYADTYCIPQNSLQQNSLHISIYHRENRVSGDPYGVSIGCGDATTFTDRLHIIPREGNPPTNTTYGVNNSGTLFSFAGDTDSRAMYINSRTSNTATSLFKNATRQTTSGTAATGLANQSIIIGAYNDFGATTGVIAYYTNKEFAFVSIGDGLTDSECSTFYNIVNRYQQALGRNVVPFDTDAQNFVTTAGITDQTQITAIDNLVKALKDTNLWSKMKAIYPFVGGTATTHKWNLKDPRDVDAAFRLTFYGGWTHSSTGAYPNGSTGYADTYLVPNTSLGLNSNHMSFYSRIDQSAAVAHDLGCSITNNEYPTFVMITKYSNGNAYFQTPDLTNRVIVSNTNSTGYYIGTRTANNLVSYYRNGATLGTNTGAHSQTQLPTVAAVISAYRFFAGVSGYSAKQTAFVTFGDGLTSMDVYNLNNIVQNFQTTLGRAV